ncbi:MAG: hypothetical protein MPK06_04225, partial [Alphaproteobacteria bacterium]|nr:hypothetical protein [Alphaproteobacteria bacterium]
NSDSDGDGGNGRRHIKGDSDGDGGSGRRHINSDSDGDGGNGRRHIKGDNNGAALSSSSLSLSSTLKVQKGGRTMWYNSHS